MSLQTLNLTAFIVHLIFAIGLSILFAYANNKYPNKKLYGLQLRAQDLRSKLEFTEDNTTKVCTYKIIYEGKNSIDLPYWLSQASVAVFFFITSGFHLFYYLDDRWNGAKGIYRTAIANRNQYFRWIEYSITASIMLGIIMSSSGVIDTNSYIFFFFLSGVLQLQGQAIEKALQSAPMPEGPLAPVLSAVRGARKYSRFDALKSAYIPLITGWAILFAFSSS